MKVRLTPEDRDRITRFRVAFNAVEQAIRKRFAQSRSRFLDLLNSLQKVHPEWKYCESLRALANLRNDIAHAEGTDKLRAVPTERAIEELLRIRKSITWLDAVGQRFRRQVECVTPEDSLAEVLRLIRLRDYSQFPVVDGTRIKGLLTENGITRWLAENSEGAGVPQYLSKVRVGALLKGDENRGAYEVVRANTTVEAAINKMSSHPTLEALLISETQSTVVLKGIVTRWDVLQILGEQR